MNTTYLKNATNANYLGRAICILSIGLSFKIATAKTLNLGYGENSLVLENQTKDLLLQQQKLKNVTEKLNNKNLKNSDKRELTSIKKELAETEQNLGKINQELSEPISIIEELIE